MAESAIAAASLRRLSPSTSVVSRRGAPTSRKTPMTAPGSVVARIAPTSRHETSAIEGGRPLTGARAKPTNTVETTTATIAIRSTGPMSSSRRRTSTASAASNSRTGRKR
jgi:hypothetical protein